MAAALVGLNQHWPYWALATLSFAVALAAGQFNISIIQPTPVYSGFCDYNYDAVTGEALRFTVEAYTSLGWDYTLLVHRPNDFRPLPGCETSHCTHNNTCVADCYVSSRVASVPDAGSYAVVASSYDTTQSDFGKSICITVKDRPQIRFDGAPVVASGSSQVNLTYVADGYPKPLSYELLCDGNITLSSSSGQFRLAQLRVGLINCTAVAYTSRRLAQTVSKPVSIDVIGVIAGSSSSIPASPISLATALTTTAPVLAPPNAGASRDAQVDQTQTIVVPVTVATGVLVTVALAAVLVTLLAKRTKRSANHNLGAPATPTALLPPGPPFPATVINNTNSYIQNFNGTVVEVYGPGSSICATDPRGNDSNAVHVRHGGGSQCPQPTVHRFRHGGDEYLTYECPIPTDLAAMPVPFEVIGEGTAVEVDGEETALKHCHAYPIAQG